MDRETIMGNVSNILEVQEKVSEYIHRRLCVNCDELADEEWLNKRKAAFKLIRGLIDKYTFSKRLPLDELGILTQSIISHLLDIQHTFLRVLVLIDILQDEPFNEIFMDSLSTISSKVNEMMTALRKMVNQRAENLEEAEETLEILIKLEREIDEDNIVICRQISVASGSDCDFVSYIMRKIVAELEHISDYAKECAEIVAEI
jgi:uncharacterized protein Yka (UPF0111/DUF47 family)